MPDRVPRLRANEVIRVLRQHGFTLVSQRGSHQKWRNDNTGKQVLSLITKASNYRSELSEVSSEEAESPKKNSIYNPLASADYSNTILKTAAHNANGIISGGMPLALVVVGKNTKNVVGGLND